MLAGCSAGDSVSSAVPATAFKPGSTRGDDPYFPAHGNGGYDVRDYRLKLAFNPATGRLDGTATITATATQDLSRLSLDLTGLTVSSITIDGQPAPSTTSGGKVTMTLPTGIRHGRSFTASLRYSGRPAATHEGGWRTSKDFSYVLSAPTSAASWFPANDKPSDKASFAVEVTVPKGLTVISNGSLRGRADQHGRTTWRWHEPTPMAPHLAYVAIGKYRLATTTHRGKPVITAVPPSMPAKVLARTGEIADWFEGLFGAYPFDSYGGVVVDDPQFSTTAATQTRPLYGAQTLTGEPSNTTAVVARAVASQWFGASVTPQRWPDIWLSEGFATYAQWLWTEHDGGDSVESVVQQRYSTYPWQVLRATDPGAGHLLSSGPYDRGAMTLHALRRLIGDEVFFQLLRSWAAEHAHGTATTAQFVRAAEKASGQRLNDFFDVWLSGAYRPTY